MYLSLPKFWQKHKGFSNARYYSITVCLVLMLTIPYHIPDAVVPLNTKQETPIVDITETDLQGGSYHFSQQVRHVQVVCLCKVYMNPIILNRFVEGWGWLQICSNRGKQMLPPSFSSHFISPPAVPHFLTPTFPSISPLSPFCLPSTYSNLNELLPDVS